MLRRLARDTAVYALGSFGSRAIGLLLLPVYTFHLSVGEYGVLETLLVTVQILLIFFNCGMSQAIVRFWHEATEHRATGVLLGSTLVTTGALSVLFSTAVVWSGLRWSHSLFGQSLTLVVLVGLTTAAGSRAVHQQLVAAYRAAMRPGPFVAASVAAGLLWFGICYLLVAVLQLGISGALWSQSLAFGVVALTVLYAQSKTNKLAMSTEVARQALQFGGPLVLSMASWFVMNAANRYFLAGFRTFEDVAVYSVGFRIAAFHSLGVVTPLQLALGPLAFRLVGTRELSRFLGETLLGFLWLLGLSATAMAMIADGAVTLLAPDKYGNAVAVTLWLLPSTFSMGIYYWGASLLHIAQRTASIGRIIALAAAVNVLLNVVLVPELGWLGAVMATDISVIGAALSVTLTGLRCQSVQVRRLPVASAAIVLPILYAVAILSHRIAFPTRIAAVTLLLLAAALVWGKQWKRMTATTQSTSPEPPDSGLEP